MRINSCIISFEGGIGGKEIKIPEGASVLYGENNSGKTRFSKALAETIWPQLNGSGRDLWDNTFISLNVNIDNESFIISRNKNRTYSIKLKDSDRNILSIEAYDGEKAFRISKDKLYILSPKLSKEILRFSNNSFIATSLLPSPLEGPAFFDAGSLHEFFTDDGSQFIRAFDSLKSPDSAARKSLIREISDLQAEFRRIRKELDIIGLSTSRTNKLSEEISRTTAELSELSGKRDELNKAKELIESCAAHSREAEEITNSINSENTQIQIEKNKIDSFKNSKQKISSIFPQFSNFGEIQRNNLEKIHGAYRAVKSAQAEHENACEKYSLLTKHFIRKSVFILIVFVIIPFLIYFFAQNLSFSVKKYILFSGSTAAAASLLLSYFPMKSKRKNIPVAESKEAILKAESGMHEILRENSIIIEKFSIHEVFEFLIQYFEEYGSFSEQEDEAHSLGQTIKTPDYFSEKNKELKALSARLHAISEETKINFSEACRIIGETENSSITHVLIKIESELESVNSSIESTTEMLNKLSSEIKREEIRGDAEALFSAHTRIEKRIEELNSLGNSLTFATELLDKSAKLREKKLMQRTIADALPIFHTLTLNRHVSDINSRSFEDFILSSQPYSNINTGFNLLLSFKLALSDIMADEGIIPPLILDEPTANMDSERIKKFIEIIGRYSDKRQIIILSHNREQYQGIFPIVDFVK